MDKNYLVQLTNSLYRLTLLFPKKEPLRYKMRELADEILAKICGGRTSANPTSVNLIESGSLSVLKDLEIVDCFFEIIKEQNWVGRPDILAVQREYANLREEFKKIKTETEKKEENPLIDIRYQSFLSQAMSERQEKILAFLKEQGRAQVWQIKQILPEVTKRTLRRDFENLLKKGLVERTGERNNTFYQIKIAQA